MDERKVMCEISFKLYSSDANLLYDESFSIQTAVVFLVSTVLMWWGCCNRSVDHDKRPRHRSAASDETGAATTPVNSVTQTTKTAGEDVLSKSRSVPRTSVINLDIVLIF